jgi:hypothetical protein
MTTDDSHWGLGSTLSYSLNHNRSNCSGHKFSIHCLPLNIIKLICKCPVRFIQLNLRTRTNRPKFFEHTGKILLYFPDNGYGSRY